MDLSYPPFETIDPQGNPMGVSVDIAEGLADFLQRPLRIENTSFTGLIPALRTGKVDVVISSMTKTEERAEAIDFSEPYLTTGLALLIPKNSELETLDVIDRDGNSVAVRQGTTGEVWARANLKNAKILAFEKENSAVLEVLQGKAQAFIYDQMSVWQNARQHPDALRAVLQPIRVESWAIGIRRGNAELREEVNAFLKAFRAEGGFERLGEKYLHEQKQAFAEQNIPFVF
ncbi:MAG: transporter substrate-binding domain-containing protein [Chthoniobacterales bacterium]